VAVNDGKLGLAAEWEASHRFGADRIDQGGITVLGIHHEYETAAGIVDGCIGIAPRTYLRKDLACSSVEQRRGIAVAVGAQRYAARQWNDRMHVLAGDQLPGRLLSIQVNCRNAESPGDIEAPRRAVDGRVVEARISVLMGDRLQQNHVLVSGIRWLRKHMRTEADTRKKTR
jgi:hypothetical protein